MPIYEYECVEEKGGCERCRGGFEVIQALRDAPLTTCPLCGASVRKRISVTRVILPGSAPGSDPVERKVAEYERQGMFSHAAELADKESEKPERAHLKERAMENYKRAGYDV
jgi:putative FmdB family regulatory protein